MRQRDPTLPLHVITPLEVSQQRTGLRIILRATPQLEQFPQAKAAFLRAAQTWERWIRNPITIVLDVDFGPTRFGQPYPPRVIGSTRSQEIIGNVYPDVRSLLLQGASSPQERDVYTALPQEQVPTDLEETSTSTIAAPSAVLRAIGAISPVANPDGERVRFGDPPSIGFNSNIPFDFTPEDGIDPDKIDFDATVVHEIGHALGFTSLVGLRELIPQVPVAVSVLDLFRFRPGVTLATFSTAQRILSSGGEHIFFAGPPALPLSTGRPDGSGGDGQQASHWKDDALTGQYIGIMDPTAQLGQRMVLTENDVRAFDFLGYWVERFTVNTTEDTVDVNPGDGICADSSGNCSLRAAIMEANTLPAAAIVLQSGQTYTLSLDNRATPGDGPTADEDDLDIRSEIIIQGNGATIQRDPTLRCHLNRVSNTGEFRIFEVTGTGDLTLQNVTVRNGCADGSVDFGGGILVYSNGTLNAMGSTISGNSAGSGGGIGNFGIATITNSTISGNSARGSGGGIWNFDTVTITNSTISGNSAGFGGGIRNFGIATITNSTISGNSAGSFGGGIYNEMGTVTITNGTISGNSAASFSGGGIIVSSGTANLSFVTIASNSANTGGGIRVSAGTVNIKNSIVGNNTASTEPNCSGGVTATGANFATDGTCTRFTTVPSTGPGGLNLGPLANNGGPTQTHALQAGSVAINAVPSGQCSDVNGNPVTQDQRGVPRPQGSRCDVGAYEAAAASTQAVTLEGGGDRLQLDLQNQTYRFRTRTGDLFTGSIRLMRRGSVIQFNSLPGETGILEGTVNLIPGRGQAVLRTFFPWQTFSITDPNLSDNTCVP
jgi:CSLREA domain-containing protein